MGRLDELDLSRKLSKEESEREIAKLQLRLLELRLSTAGLIGDGRLGPPVCVMFEGWDASGKGGAIKRLVARLDPRHVRVGEYAAPTDDERRHHFLWRFEPNIPAWGGFSVFDRTWYGRVLVERVENFATNAEWQRAYQEICDFERMLVEEGTTLVKFFLHISSDEQLARFESRHDDPLRAWKLTDDDWRNREKWTEYKAAIEEMLDRTDHAHCRWQLIPAESKHFARVAVLDRVVREMEAGLRRAGIDVPSASGADFDPNR